MNQERILELAVEAEDYADGIVDQGGEFHPAYTRKLAELIVRECIGVIGEENYTMLTGKAYCTKLKRHFGVKK